MSATPSIILNTLETGQVKKAVRQATRYSAWRLFQEGRRRGWTMRQAMVTAQFLKGCALWKDYLTVTPPPFEVQP